MILARNGVQMFSALPNPGREFFAVERKHHLLQKLNVVESSMSHKVISRNFLLQYKSVDSEGQHRSCDDGAELHSGCLRSYTKSH